MSDKLEQRLRRDLSMLDGVSICDDGAVQIASRSAIERAARRRRRAVIGASLALATAGGAGVWSIGGGTDEVAMTDVGASTETSSLGTGATVTTMTIPSTSSGGWQPIAADPRGTVLYPSVVWADDVAIVVGGRDLDGSQVLSAAKYVPATDRWEFVPDPPGDLGSEGRIDTLSVWTGSEMLVLGGDLPDGSPVASSGQAYDPAANVWRATATPPGLINTRSPWVWTATELLVWPSDAGDSTADVTPLAYDPETDQWRELAAPPVQRRQRAASVWTGSEWVIWGGANNGVDHDDGAAYNPSTNSWRVLAESPLSARRVRAAWTGTEMIVAAGSSGGNPVTGNGENAHDDGAAYDPSTDTWRPIASGPTHPGFEPIWTGRQLLMFAKGGVVIYDPASDQWADDCCGGSGTTVTGSPVWTGNTALLVGSPSPSAGGASYAPPA